MKMTNILAGIIVCITIPNIHAVQNVADIDFHSLHVKMESMDSKIALLQRNGRCQLKIFSFSLKLT